MCPRIALNVANTFANHDIMSQCQQVGHSCLMLGSLLIGAPLLFVNEWCFIGVSRPRSIDLVHLALRSDKCSPTPNYKFS